MIPQISFACVTRLCRAIFFLVLKAIVLVVVEVVVRVCCAVFVVISLQCCVTTVVSIVVSERVVVGAKIVTILGQLWNLRKQPPVNYHALYFAILRGQ